MPTSFKQRPTTFLEWVKSPVNILSKVFSCPVRRPPLTAAPARPMLEKAISAEKLCSAAPPGSELLLGKACSAAPAGFELLLASVDMGATHRWGRTLPEPIIRKQDEHADEGRVESDRTNRI